VVVGWALALDETIPPIQLLSHFIHRTLILGHAKIIAGHIERKIEGTNKCSEVYLLREREERTQREKVERWEGNAWQENCRGT
jgi:hypothetical protein